MEKRALTELCRDFLGHLRSEEAHLIEHKETLVKERRAVLDRALGEIQDCLKQKEMLEMQGRIIEATRKKLLGRMIDELGYVEDQEQGPLRWLIERAEEPLRSELSEMHTGIKEHLEAIGRLSEGNQFMIRSALNRISQSLGFLRQFQSVLGVTYDGGGKVKTGSFSNRHIRQQA